MTICNPKTILSVPITEPELIFEPSYEAIRAKYLQLLKEWHPDRNPDPKAGEVTQHIIALGKSAEQKLTSGLWAKPDTVEILTLKGKRFRFVYHTKRSFELGLVYIGAHHVLFAVENRYRSAYQNAVKRIDTLPYAAPVMRDQMAKYLPKVTFEGEGLDYHYILIQKPRGAVLLGDLLKHYEGKLTPKHVGWIINRVLNISCYLSWAGISHNAIGLDTVFVCPKNHAAYLLGGWWYAQPIGASLRGQILPKRSVGIMSSTQLRERIANLQLDQDLIRLLARELLGNPSGSMLRSYPEVPAAITSWVNTTATQDAIASYEQWKGALVASFGPPKFVKMNVTADQIYKGV